MFSVSMLCCLALASAAVTIGGLLSQHYYPAVIAGLITLLLVPAIAENMLEKRRRKKSAAKEPPPAPKRTHTQSSRSPSRSASKSIRAVEGQSRGWRLSTRRVSRQRYALSTGSDLTRARARSPSRRPASQSRNMRTSHWKDQTG